MADIYSVLDARSLPKLLQMLGPRDAIALVTVSKRSRDAVRSQPAWHRAWKAWSGSRWGSRIDAIADDLSEEELAEAGLGRVATSDKRKETTPKQSFWERYYARRSSTWIPIASPMTMFQESYGFDPWQLLAGCVLSSRTSGGETVWAPIRAFHAKFPTPTAVVEEAEINGLERMGKMLKPLGLNRESTISRTALGFLRQWTRPSELYGCGKFAEDSWLAFCHGQVARVASDAAADRNVRAYAIWATKELCAAKALPGPRSLLEGVVGSKLSAAAARRKATKPRWAEEPDSDSYDEDCEGDEGDGDGSDGDDSIQAAGGAGGGLAKAQLLSSVIAEQAHRRQRAAAQASSRQERAARRMATTAASTTSAFSSSSVIGRGDTNDDEKDDDDYLATPRSKPRGKPRASTTTTPRTSSKTTPRALGKAARSGSRQSNNPAVGKAQHVSSKRGRALGGAGGALERALGLVPATPASKRRTPPSSA